MQISKVKAAELLGVHRNTINNLIAKGDLSGTSFADLLDYSRKQIREEECQHISRALDRYFQTKKGE